MLSLHEILGYSAAVCTTGSLIPQLLRVWRTRSAEDISLRMFAVLGLGNILWFTYGMVDGSPSILVANATAFFLVAAIISLKIRFG
jgi:MtN3 and saliva related transmembrane protein